MDDSPLLNDDVVDAIFHDSKHVAKFGTSRPLDPQELLNQPMWRNVIRRAGTAGTQKVRGFNAAASLRELIGGDAYAASPWWFAKARDVIRESDRRPDILSPLSFPFFLRPCPTRPRHGFVDSRQVSTPKEVLAVAMAALSADPDAELIACPFLDAAYSAVLTPGSFSLGEGHDGATSGQSITVYGPAPTSDHLAWITQSASIAPGDIPYVELVQRRDPATRRPFSIVQVRGGPQLVAASDFVPEPTKVTQVLIADHDTDLVQWETDIAIAVPGTVVYAPGLSLAAHQCVHAVIHRVPVLTTREPVVGEMLEPTDTPKWTSDDWHRLARFIQEADSSIATMELARDNAMIATSALHCAGYPVEPTDPQLRMLAYGVVSALKCTAAASFGEARYLRPGGRLGRTPAHRALRYMQLALTGVDWERYIAREAAGRCNCSQCVNVARLNDRDYYYSRTARASIQDLRRGLQALGPIFRYGSWALGCGGPKWAQIALGAKHLAHVLCRFQAQPSADTWTRVVEVWNTTIHREHNGDDTAFQKFGLSKRDMNKAAIWPVGQFASGVRPEMIRAVFYGDTSYAAMGAAQLVRVPAREELPPLNKHISDKMIAFAAILSSQPLELKEVLRHVA